MKRFLIFILLLASSFCTPIFACYFYPYGEDIRFSIFSPTSFKSLNGFMQYNYSYTRFYPEYIYSEDFITENDEMWFLHCKKQVPITEIKKAVFGIEIDDFNFESNNQFVQYLYRTKDNETIDYLLFAKSIEDISSGGDDLWEYNTELLGKKRDEKIKIAYNNIKKTKNNSIKKRYYYQIFRLLQNNNEKLEIQKLYRSYCKVFKKQDFLDDWAAFFNMTAEQSNVKMNYLAAQVFASGTDNKFDVSCYFNRHIPIEQVLKFAKNDKERTNILVIYSFRKLDFNLKNIEKAAKYDVSNSGLCFMLLREINKIEDWVLTPTYTMYLPILRNDYWENSNGTRILQRAEVDRAYARDILMFVNAVDENKVYDKHFWLLSKAYLQFITKKYADGLATIKQLDNYNLNKEELSQRDIVKSLILTANQEKNKAIIPNFVKQTLLYTENGNNHSFLFALAKELEFLNNKVDAAFLISKTDVTNYDYVQSSMFWRSSSSKITLHDDFYNGWYEYMDAELSTQDMQTLINYLHNTNSKFDTWITQNLINQPAKVNDLMGIKYMRDDNLKMALHYFSKIPNDHYTNATLFNENPFYKIKGYMNFDKSKTEKGLNKAKMVAQLINLIKKAENRNNKNRSKDYFLVANCYYNMSFYGNSWMLKRISRTDNGDLNYADENEYYRCNLAKYYYQKAKQYTKSTNFDALCMYMIGKCDARDMEYNIIKKHRKWDFYYDYGDKINDVNNQAFNNFITKYPNQYMNMLSNCEIFSAYYRS